MASRQPNTNWHNIPGTSQVSWRTESKLNCDCPHDDVNSHTRSQSDAGLTSGYHVDPPAQNRYTSFSSTASSSPASQFSSLNQSRGTSVATSVGSSQNGSQRPSLVDLVKVLPPVLESSSGTHFNTAEFAKSLERPLAMSERHQKIRSAIETLESILRNEEQDYQRQQQKILEQQRIIEQQRLQEQQRQQQLASNNAKWNQSTYSSYARNGSISIFDEIQAEHDQRAYEASLKREQEEEEGGTERDRKFSLFKSKKHTKAAAATDSVIETRERKASEWAVAAPTIPFRERKGSSDWYSTATAESSQRRKASSDLTSDMVGSSGGWYGAAAERKASVFGTESNARKASFAIESNMRKGSSVSMASNYRKGSTAEMPKTRRPSDWGASTACFA